LTRGATEQEAARHGEHALNMRHLADDLLDFERDAVRLLRGRTGRQAYEHTHVAIVDLRQELVAEVVRQQEDAGESSDRAAQHIPALGEHSGSIAAVPGTHPRDHAVECGKRFPSVRTTLEP